MEKHNLWKSTILRPHKGMPWIMLEASLLLPTVDMSVFLMSTTVGWTNFDRSVSPLITWDMNMFKHTVGKGYFSISSSTASGKVDSDWWWPTGRMSMWSATIPPFASARYDWTDTQTHDMTVTSVSNSKLSCSSEPCSAELPYLQ